jgi:hypothetical protein
MIKNSLLFIFVICFLSLISNAQTQTLLKNDEIPKDLEISLERTICFGSCPGYTLIIKANGDIIFDGKDYTQTKGRVEGKIKQEVLKQIIIEFEKANFFELNDYYADESNGCKEVWTDNPSEIISIKINGKSKKVGHYFGCRKVEGNVLDRIINLGRRIDELSVSKRWTGIPDENDLRKQN